MFSSSKLLENIILRFNMNRQFSGVDDINSQLQAYRWGGDGGDFPRQISESFCYKFLKLSERVINFPRNYQKSYFWASFVVFPAENRIKTLLVNKISRYHIFHLVHDKSHEQTLSAKFDPSPPPRLKTIRNPSQTVYKFLLDLWHWVDSVPLNDASLDLELQSDMMTPWDFWNSINRW